MTFITLDTLVFINLSLLSILTLLFLYLMVNKLKDIQLEKRKESLKQEMSPEIQAYVFGNGKLPTLYTSMGYLEVTVLEDILSQLGAVVKDSRMQEKINYLGRELLSSHYENHLHKANWSRRMNTYFNIENFLLDNFKGVLWEKFQQKNYENEEEKFQQMKTLASLRSEDFIKYLIETDKEYPRFLYKEIIRRYDEEVFSQLVDKYENLPVDFKQALLEMIGEMKSFQYYPLIEKELTEKNIEVRLSALKVLVLFGYVSDLDRIAPFAHSKHFAERMVFARLCAILKKERFKGILVTLLSDKNWFVRNAAGEAITVLPNGDLILNISSNPMMTPLLETWLNNG
ncbi:MAG: HEAT repeat domain-containing protein [Bacillus sp. (in: Bacteria)]|nr:HEAT repeat domain-containing protein [Bacillus sp. (in: firmicutes)]